MPQDKDEKDLELKQIAALIKIYLSKATGRIEASSRLQDVEKAVRIGKLNCLSEFFGD